MRNRKEEPPPHDREAPLVKGPLVEAPPVRFVDRRSPTGGARQEEPGQQAGGGASVAAAAATAANAAADATAAATVEGEVASLQ